MAKADHKSEQQDFQEKYLEYNHYKQQIQLLSEELSTLSITAQALGSAKETIENLDKAKDNDEILVPLGAQVFAKASLSNVKEVLMNVGAGTVIKKDIASAVKSLGAQQKEVSDISNQLTAQLKELGERMEVLEKDLDSYAQKINAEKAKK